MPCEFPLHGHAALFGVYGMLGTLQLLAAIEHGYWFARSAEFMQKPLVDRLVWMRVPGDTIFSVGALSLSWFVLRLWLWPKQDAGSPPPQ